MNFRITEKEGRFLLIAKLCYLIPFIIVAYIPAVIIAGIKEIGNPFDGIERIKRTWRKTF